MGFHGTSTPPDDLEENGASYYNKGNGLLLDITVDQHVATQPLSPTITHFTSHFFNHLNSSCIKETLNQDHLFQQKYSCKNV